MRFDLEPIATHKPEVLHCQQNLRVGTAVAQTDLQCKSHRFDPLLLQSDETINHDKMSICVVKMFILPMQSLDIDILFIIEYPVLIKSNLTYLSVIQRLILQRTVLQILILHFKHTNSKTFNSINSSAYIFLSYDAASENVIKPCIKNDNPLVD